MSAPAFYYLAITASNLSVTVEVNSFPVYSHEMFPAPLEQSIAINQYLRLENTLFVTLSPITPNEEKIDLSDYSFSITIKAYNRGEMVGPDTGETIYKANLDDVAGDGLPRFPMTFEETFTNEGFDFSETIQKLKPVSQEEALDFSKQLYAMFENQDAEGFFSVSEPYLVDYCQAYNHPVPQFRQMMLQMLKDTLAESPVRPQKPEEIQVVPSQNGLIWIPKRSDQPLPLLVTKEDEDGAFTQYPVMIGKIGGEMYIVR